MFERHIATIAAVMVVVASLATPAHAGWNDVLEADRIVVESTTPKEATDSDAGARRHLGTATSSTPAPSPTVQVTTLRTWLDAWRELLNWMAG